MTLLQMFKNHKISCFFPDSTKGKKKKEKEKKKTKTVHCLCLMNNPGCLQFNTYE